MEALYITLWILIPLVVAALASAKFVAENDIKAVAKARTNRKFDQHVDEALTIANQK